MLQNSHRPKILAVGDCNTLGAGQLEKRSYPERLGSLLGLTVQNCGLTMATTREGLQILKDNLGNDPEIVIFQFGLVDSYKTFKYSPYVYYYPDNFFRKQARSLVKKYKKTSRNLGLCKTLGEVNVVALKEYRGNYEKVLELTRDKIVILPETIPNHDTDRNPDICRYNKEIKKVCESRTNCVFIPLYESFLQNIDNYYLDTTHSNEVGYDIMADKIQKALQSK